MSFHKYNNTASQNIDFRTLAKYANHKRNSDISLNQCVDDLDAYGDTGSTPGKGLGWSKGASKSDNFTFGAPYVAKARCNVIFNCQHPLQLDDDPTVGYYLIGGVTPTLNPFGATLTVAEQNDHCKPLDIFELDQIRFWMWAEEDDDQYPMATFPESKSDRLMFGETVGGIEIGQAFGDDFVMTGLLGETTIETGYDDPLAGLMDQSNVYGVPEGFCLSRYRISHRYNGSGTYYLWRGLDIRVQDSGMQGFSTLSSATFGSWSSFTRGITNNSTVQTVFPTSGQIRDKITSGILLGLEDNFDPDDNVDGNRNFADFDVQVSFSAFAYIP